MNKEQGIRHLLYAVKDIDRASNCFRDYLNSGSKESWDQFIISSFMFSLDFCQICDKNLLDREECVLIHSCLDKHDEMFNFNDYTPEKRGTQEKILEILWEIKKVFYPFTLKILNENNLTGNEIAILECDSLLQNSRGHL